MRESLPTLATTTEAADYLQVSEGQIEQWAAEGRLPIAGRTGSGLALFYSWVVERNGVALAAGEQVRVVHRVVRRPRGSLLFKPRVRPCGCCLPPASRRDADGLDPQKPIFLCRDAVALDQTRRLIAAFALAAPADPFFRRLADVTREAFERHIADPGQRNATAPPGRDSAQLLVCGQTPLSDCAPLRRHSHQRR